MAKRGPHPHVAWRNGRPRFQPASGLRLAGHVGKDLRHPDGRWFSISETIAWSEAFVERLPDDAPAPALAPITGSYQRGFVYFLWAGDAIKVGYSGNPFRRTPEIMTGVAAPVRLFVAVPGTSGDERRLHRRLRSQHLRGEWFKASLATLTVLRMVLNESSGIKGEQT